MSFPIVMSDDYLDRRVERDELRSSLLTVRAPMSLRDRIKALADFLTQKDRVENKDAPRTTSGDVVVRLIVLGLEGAWKQAGLPAKPTKEEIAAKLRELKSN